MPYKLSTGQIYNFSIEKENITTNINFKTTLLYFPQKNCWQVRTSGKKRICETIELQTIFGQKSDKNNRPRSSPKYKDKGKYKRKCFFTQNQT